MDKKNRYSNLSGRESNGNLNNSSCIFSDDSSRMMMISDEHTGTNGVYGANPHQSMLNRGQSLHQRGASREVSRGRTIVASSNTTIEAQIPTFKKN